MSLWLRVTWQLCFFLRLFLSLVPDTYPKSTLHEYDNALSNFTSLNDKYINWNSGKEGIGSEIETDVESTDDEDWTPCAKRARSK